jgi:hypothetical protein
MLHKVSDIKLLKLQVSMYFLFQTNLRLAATHCYFPPFIRSPFFVQGPYAVADGNLITGQNPGSSAEVAKLIVKALSS